MVPELLWKTSWCFCQPLLGFVKVSVKPHVRLLNLPDLNGALVWRNLALVVKIEKRDLKFRSTSTKNDLNPSVFHFLVFFLLVIAVAPCFFRPMMMRISLSSHLRFLNMPSCTHSSWLWALGSFLRIPRQWQSSSRILIIFDGQFHDY